MSNEHTPTPWVVGERKLPYGDGTKFHTERWICTEWIHPQLKAQYPIMTVSLGVGLRGENPYYLSHMEAENAAHIVKCVNAHDALVEALQSIVDMCNEDSHARDYASRQTEIRGTAIVALRKIQRSQMNNDLDQWKPYLKEGETPFERFVRDRADTDALLELYKKAIAAPQRELTDADYKATLKEISVLMESDPDLGSAEGDRLDILVTLVQAYEAKCVDWPTAPPSCEWQGLTDDDWDKIQNDKILIGDSSVVWAIRLTETLLRAKNEVTK